MTHQKVGHKLLMFNTLSKIAKWQARSACHFIFLLIVFNIIILNPIFLVSQLKYTKSYKIKNFKPFEIIATSFFNIRACELTNINRIIIKIPFQSQIKRVRIYIFSLVGGEFFHHIFKTLLK